jgi:DNA polymerase-4
MRHVVHWDGDSFFASIEQASDRRLRGRPVAVGGARRGVVVSASREARRYGIHPGMPTGKARRRCPPLIVLPGHFDLYEQFFHDILGLCQEETPLVEPVAVGAAFLDLTGAPALRREGAEGATERLRRTVGEWLRISISAGVGANKTVARIAARIHKPAAQVVVPPGGEAEFLAPLDLEWLPGVGEVSRSTLEVAGIRRIGELARAPLDALALVLGRQALALQRRAQGVDEEPVVPRRTWSPALREQVEFPEDVWDEARLLVVLREMLERLMARVRSEGAEIRRITLKLRYTDRDESERSLTLAEPAGVESEFRAGLERLLRSAWQRRVRLRAVCLEAGTLYRPSPQMELFAEAQIREREYRLASAIDRLRANFGAAAVHWGYQLPAKCAATL